MKLIFFLYFIFNFSLIQAASMPRKGLGLTLTGPDRRWVVTPLKKMTSQEGVVYAQTFTRYIFEVEKPYELGNISYFSIPLNKNNKHVNDVKDVQSAFEKMFDIKPFILSSYRGRKNQWMLEGEYAKHGRFVRLIITKHSTRFSFTIAYLRKPYLGSTDFSSAWIQDRLIEREEQMIENEGSKKTTFNFDLFPKAYAEGSGGSSSSGTFDPITVVKADGTTIQIQPCTGPGALPTTSSPTTCPNPSSCPPSSPPTTAAYHACIQNIANCRTTQLQATATALQGQVNSVQQDIKCQSDWWSAKMDHYSQEWGERADRGLDILEKALSPLGVASLAAAGVVGASVASFGMSLAISGIQAGAEALWKLVSGAYAEEKHQEILKIFMENKEKWDQMNDEAMSLVSKIDNAVELLEFVKLSGKSLEEIILENKSKMVELETSVEDAKEKYQKMKDQYDDESNTCVQESKTEYNTLKKELMVLQMQVDQVEKIKREHGNFEKMCSTLKHNLDTLLQLEGDLQNARVLMLDSYDHFQIEEGKRREKLRESGRGLQLEDAKKSYADEVSRASKSFQSGIGSAEISGALAKATEACYKDHISRNGWHNIICRTPILAPIPLIGGVSSEEEAGMESACYYYQKKCSKPDQRKNYLYRIAHENLGDFSTKKRNELIRAHRQYTGLLNTYDSDLKIAKETLDQKSKVKEYLNYNEEVSRSKSEAVHNWMMSMRLEQACTNLPTNCDDKAGNLFTKLRTGNLEYNNEVVRKIDVNGKGEIKCQCKVAGASCNCPEIENSEYFKCRQTKAECDSNKQGLVCYNLPYCPPKDDGDTSHCNEYCPKVIPECNYSQSKTCLDQKEVNKLCLAQFKACADEKLQTGCEIHFNRKCLGSKEFCDKFSEKCQEQALNRAKFRFEKIRVQSDLIKEGACKEVLR